VTDFQKELSKTISSARSNNKVHDPEVEKITSLLHNMGITKKDTEIRQQKNILDKITKYD
jgi:hypothetical protein